MCSWLLLMSMELLADQLQAHAAMPSNEPKAFNHLIENYQMNPSVTRLLLRARVTSQGQVTAEARADTRGTHSSNSLASNVRKETMRTDMAKNRCADNFVTPCRSSFRPCPYPVTSCTQTSFVSIHVNELMTYERHCAMANTAHGF